MRMIVCSGRRLCGTNIDLTYALFLAKSPLVLNKKCKPSETTWSSRPIGLTRLLARIDDRACGRAVEAAAKQRSTVRAEPFGLRSRRVLLQTQDGLRAATSKYALRLRAFGATLMVNGNYLIIRTGSIAINRRRDHHA
ncbi:MAG: hypothetical protein WB784_00205, partial [Rhodanobacteraceae bacterium]